MPEPSAYERQPYLARLSTEVAVAGEVEGKPFAIPADTVLYPEGGGQPADRGSLNGIRVVDVQRADDGIRHFLEAPVAVGPAELELDWRRRFDHMQQHTAQHLLSALAVEHFGWATTSFHLGARTCDIELDTPKVTAEALTDLEELTARAIRSALPVAARRVTPEQYAALQIRTRGLPESHQGDVRLVEIEGIDITTCGGTHLATTAEIESLALGRTEPMRGGTRLYWLAGGRVRARLAELEARNAELRQLLETSGPELVATTAARLEALQASERALRRARGEFAEARAAVLAAGPDVLVDAHFAGVDAGFLQSVARDLLANAPAKAALLTAESDKGAFFLVAAGPDSAVDPSDAGPRVAQILGGRGGGSGPIFQGKAASLEARAKALALLEK